MSLQSWTARLARQETGSGDWSYSPINRVFIRRIEQIADREIPLTPEQWDHVGRTASHHGSQILWDPRIAIEDRLRFIDTLSKLLRRVWLHAPHGGSVFMFWENPVLERHNAEDRPGYPSVGQPALRQRLYEILEAQLREADPDLQLGALHGLNHLMDDRTPRLVAELMTNFADEEVREYAVEAARFAHL